MNIVVNYSGSNYPVNIVVNCFELSLYLLVDLISHMGALE